MTTKTVDIESIEGRLASLRADTKELIQEIETDTPLKSSSKTLPNWLSFAVVAAIAAGFGLLAGLSLSGSLF